VLGSDKRSWLDEIMLLHTSQWICWSKWLTCKRANCPLLCRFRQYMHICAMVWREIKYITYFFQNMTGSINKNTLLFVSDSLLTVVCRYMRKHVLRKCWKFRAASYIHRLVLYRLTFALKFRTFCHKKTCIQRVNHNILLSSNEWIIPFKFNNKCLAV
jgi:hypothetical protein